jgi:hypothetical protein
MLHHHGKGTLITYRNSLLQRTLRPIMLICSAAMVAIVSGLFCRLCVPELSAPPFGTGKEQHVAR